MKANTDEDLLVAWVADRAEKQITTADQSMLLLQLHLDAILWSWYKKKKLKKKKKKKKTQSNTLKCISYFDLDGIS